MMVDAVCVLMIHTIMYCNGDDIQHVTDNLQQCLNSAGEWYVANRLVLNTGKCNVMLLGASIIEDDRSECKLSVSISEIAYP